MRDSNIPQHLHPYNGEQLERLEGLGRSHVRRAFGEDRSGRRIYRFNQLGFRGDEPDLDAPYRVFAFGESHAFGYFVDFEQCWPSRFVELWCRNRKLDRRDVCYLSFADAGASNAAIARWVITQCTALRPDLVLVHFADLARSEVVLDGRPHRVGPWLLEEKAAEAAREAPSENGLPETLAELIERGSSFFRYSMGRESGALPPIVDPTCLLENLRNILWVQHFCKSEGIPLVATCEPIEAVLSPSAQEDPIVGPLIRNLDRKVLCELGIWSVEGDVSDDPGHAGPTRHQRFAQAMFDFYRLNQEGHGRNHEGKSRLPGPTPSHDADDAVRDFYRQLPFNFFDNARAAARSLRENPIPQAYPDMHRLLRGGGSRVADCGCGAGWLANTLALHYDAEVTGMDFTPPALERARHVARRLGVESRVLFVEHDLMELTCEGRFDLVISLGVLHHTVDPYRAFERVQRLACPGGHVYVGLYHRPGRQPFLDHFRRILQDGGEASAYAELSRLCSDRPDDEHLRSWFRDQVLHPRESQHTLREVAGWLESTGLELVSTSINEFKPVKCLETLFALEAEFEARSRRALQEGRFFPGFFTVLARRPAPAGPIVQVGRRLRAWSARRSRLASDSHRP